MKTSIESSNIGNSLPSITIRLTRSDLAKLVESNKLIETTSLEGKNKIIYFQETQIIVE